MADIPFPWEKKEASKLAFPWERAEGDEEMSASEAMWFAGRLGAGDTLRGLGQLIPGDIFEEGMAESQAKLNSLMENPEYGGSVTGAYFGGLLADPA